MLISATYRKLNADLHKENPAYGISVVKYVANIAQFGISLGAESVLDYGCGKGLLAENIGEHIVVREYDPAIEAKSAEPDSADLVVCVDVMEHIEPLCVDDVVKHLSSKALKGVFLTICIVPAKKTLADGRNAHISIHSAGWWLDKFSPYFKDVVYIDGGNTFGLMLSSPKIKQESEG